MKIHSENLDDLALQYHRQPRPGKIAIAATKPLATQRDLALAYSPGVAAACRAIVDDEAAAYEVTGRGNMVAVVTNGSAVLGLGAIGPLAAKPVMEGKAVLFKKFAGIDAFDIEIKAETADEMVQIIAAMEPTFGAINLEDIKAPECFEVESRLREKMGIPVFHDDQHGTAIVVGAAVRNGLYLVNKDISQVKLVSTGGGAAGLACLNLLVEMGLKRENVTLFDKFGLVYEGRNEDMNPHKAVYGRSDLPSDTTLTQAMDGADVFLGLSGPGVLTGAMVASMAAQPLVLALANPTPEIMPDEVLKVRDDAIIATGRSDYPNQVNNVLCFPFIFRAALDVGAKDINKAMQLACVEAIAELARSETSDVVASAYVGENLVFGPQYLLPKPFDPRLIQVIAPAVAEAAMNSGIATRPIADLKLYREQLGQYVFRSGQTMRPVMEKARQAAKRVVFAEGEDERVLRAAQAALDEGVARPILIGRRAVIVERIADLGLRMRPDEDVEVVEIIRDPRYHHFSDAYWRLMRRRGVSPDHARVAVRASATIFAALMVRRGEAEAMICGTAGKYSGHLKQVKDVLGLRPGVSVCAAMNAVILEKGTFFITDTYVNHEPSAEELAAITTMAAEEVRRFGIEPKIAMLSHSNFGSDNSESAQRMRDALNLVWERAPDLEIEGEMHSDSALSADLRDRIFPGSRLKGEANLLVMPSADAANIAFNMVKVLGDGLNVGPILLGMAYPAHIVTPSITVRGLLNMTALAVVEAQLLAERR
ncbi:NADP-dependent malic enzyme [Novispirillum itersonii]|uniref:NADP-dependent malic enzyme n=1 Tax=Novispirillum itersonii TaxID=189 RepID=UPI0003615287|nr:NADP-dependent malic enzyme [Novispirillum itersonii]